MASLVIIMILFCINVSQSDMLWDYAMGNAMPSEWSSTTPSDTKVHSGSICPGNDMYGRDYCWVIENGGDLIREAIISTNYYNLKLTYSVNTDGITSSDHCYLYYTVDGDTSNYLQIYHWQNGDEDEAVDVEYTLWNNSIVDNNNLGIRIAIISPDDTPHDCYFNEMSLSGDFIPQQTTSSPTETPTFYPPTKTPTEQPITTLSTTHFPTKSPTNQPTSKTPTISPTKTSPTTVPTHQPTQSPTDQPTTTLPTEQPTTTLSTEQPTTALPTDQPTTTLPTEQPTTTLPTEQPTTTLATEQPTTTLQTEQPTTALPTEQPTTTLPTGQPTTVLLTNQATTTLPTDEPITISPSMAISANPTTSTEHVLVVAKDAPSTMPSIIDGNVMSPTKSPEQVNENVLNSPQNKLFIQTTIFYIIIGCVGIIVIILFIVLCIKKRKKREKHIEQIKCRESVNIEEGKETATTRTTYKTVHSASPMSRTLSMMDNITPNMTSIELTNNNYSAPDLDLEGDENDDGDDIDGMYTNHVTKGNDDDDDIVTKGIDNETINGNNNILDDNEDEFDKMYDKQHKTQNGDITIGGDY